jgi:hypothetical protein
MIEAVAYCGTAAGSDHSINKVELCIGRNAPKFSPPFVPNHFLDSVAPVIVTDRREV